MDLGKLSKLTEAGRADPAYTKASWLPFETHVLPGDQWMDGISVHPGSFPHCLSVLHKVIIWLEKPESAQWQSKGSKASFVPPLRYIFWGTELLFSYCCCDKLPLALSTTTSILTVLEVRTPKWGLTRSYKIKASKGWVPSEAQEENLHLSFWSLGKASSHNTQIPALITDSPSLTLLAFSLLRMLWWHSAHLRSPGPWPHLKILTLITENDLWPCMVSQVGELGFGWR